MFFMVPPESKPPLISSTTPPFDPSGYFACSLILNKLFHPHIRAAPPCMSGKPYPAPVYSPEVYPSSHGFPILDNDPQCRAEEYPGGHNPGIDVNHNLCDRL